MNTGIPAHDMAILTMTADQLLYIVAGVGKTRNETETKSTPTNLKVIHASALQQAYFQCFLLCYGSPPASAMLVR